MQRSADMKLLVDFSWMDKRGLRAKWPEEKVNPRSMLLFKFNVVW
jgi:hypothetical protein